MNSMKAPEPVEEIVARKSYQTDCRPLADAIFWVGMMVALGAALELFNADAPTVMLVACASSFSTVLYALLTNTLTIFRIAATTAFIASLVVFGLSMLTIEMTPRVDFQTLMAALPLYSISASQAIEALLRQKKKVR